MNGLTPVFVQRGSNVISDQMDITTDQLKELTEVIEDSVQYFCDEQQVSGEAAWAVVEALSVCKQYEFHGLVSPN